LRNSITKTQACPKRGIGVELIQAKDLGKVHGISKEGASRRRDFEIPSLLFFPVSRLELVQLIKGFHAPREYIASTSIKGFLLLLKAGQFGYCLG
jgi:hypothetical protein